MSCGQIVAACVCFGSTFFCFLLIFLLNRWQRKHQLLYVVFRTPETHFKYCVEFFRNKEDLNLWLSHNRPIISLFGVYTLVPSSYLKEFGGFYHPSIFD